MEIIETDESGILVIALKGKLDSNTAPDLESVMLAQIEAGKSEIVFNMEALDYISSAGLRVFLLSAKKLKPNNGKVLLSHVADSVKQVFDVSGFSQFFPMYGTVEEAIGAISGMAVSNMDRRLDNH